MGPYSQVLADNSSAAALPDVLLCASDPSSLGIGPDKDTQTVLQERTTDSVEWNYVLWRLIDADVTVIFTAPSAAAADRLAAWLRGRPGLRLAVGPAENAFRSLRPELAEPLASERDGGEAGPFSFANAFLVVATRADRKP